MTREKWNRRNLLQVAGAGAATTMLPHPDGLAAQAPTPATVVILLLDRGTQTIGADTLAAATSAFSARALPIGHARAAGRHRPQADATYTADPALWDETAISKPRYFQARGLSEARAALAAAFPGRMPPPVLAAPDPGQPLVLSGLSPAGLRCAYLVPEATAPAWVESHPSRVVASRGGHLATLAGASDARSATGGALTYLAEAAGDPAQLHATLFVDLAGPAEAVIALSEAIAKEVEERTTLGHLVPLAPNELGVRHAQGFGRLIGLRLDPPPGAPADDPGLVGFTEALTKAGIAFSVSRDDPAALTPTDCLRLDPAKLRAAGVPAVARGWGAVTVAPADPGIAPLLAAAGIHAATGAGKARFRGVDGNGLLHLTPVIAETRPEKIDTLTDQLGLCEDAILAIDTGTLALPVRRNALIAALRRLSAVPGTRIVALDDFIRLVGAGDEVEATLRRTRALAPVIAPRPAALPTYGERAALMADARKAWAYFEAVTHEATGLPDTTVAFEDDGTPGTINDMLTQWDTGSAIFGWIAALRLGLIPQDRYDAWADKALAALADSTLPNVHLPRAIFHAGAPGRGNGDFNICDTGRLLAALKALEKTRPESDTAVRDLVASWNLAEMVIDGVPHAIDRGVVQPGPDAHCTSYIKRALALWGIEARSGYDVYNLGETETDAWMYLLNAVADIGTFGAEPLLQEALEFGFDAPGRALCDVLLAAQIESWQQTGILIAPSEGPMDRPPWFTYQGLRLDRSGPERWDVISLTPGGERHTAAFRSAAQMLTCKAPFLWAAAHPHTYCDLLLGHVRAKGQMKAGYVSGVYSATGLPTRNYGDVNTNGVILEAVAARFGLLDRL